jgi:N-acetylmuramoyl-L-alanine amidase
MIFIKKGVILLVIVLITSILNFTSIYATGETSNYNTSNATIKVNSGTLNLSCPVIDVKGNIMVSAKEVFQKLGVKVEWYPITMRVKMNNGGKILSMRVGDRNITIDGERKRMDVPPVLMDGEIAVPVVSVAQLLNIQVSTDGSLICLESSYKHMKTVNGISVPFVVVVDAGHGGDDPGAFYDGVREKDLNLDIAIRLNKLLKAEGVKTYMTRVDDRFIGLYDRSALANRVNADLLISVHNNAAESTQTRGSMSLYYPGGENSNGGLTAIGFASIVQKRMTGSLNTFDLGEISRPRLAVLRTAKMPAVIAEVGYMTNTNELRRLMDPDYRQDAAESLKNAVLEALDRI